MRVLFVFFLVISVTIACQKYCNGHGDCATGDKCECYPGWGGSDCNERSCPYSDAFVDLLPGDLDHDGVVTTNGEVGDNFHAVLNEWNPVVGTPESIGEVIKETNRAHRYAECSNAGICDRSSGLCKCNSGFEGSACQRRSCPASADGLVCSGHGMCLSSEASIVKGEKGLPSGWEYQKFGVCECDKGWTGISCGSRICPKGLDPVTKGSYTYTFTITETSGSNTLFPSTSDFDIIGHYYEMKYDNVVYTTPEIPSLTGICDNGKLVSSKASEAAEEIRRALISIPPLSQAKVSFTCVTNTKQVESILISTPYIELDLTEGSGTCSGPTPSTPYSCTIDIGTTGSNLQTKYKPASFKVKPTSGTISTTIVLKMTATSMNVKDPTGGNLIQTGDVISCSGRGSCDETSGLCQCFEGFTGVACERQRNN